MFNYLSGSKEIHIRMIKDILFVNDIAWLFVLKIVQVHRRHYMK